MNQRYGVVIAPINHIKPQSLEKVFKTCGTIESISYIEENGKKIQCQIFYSTPGAANKAVKNFDGQTFIGKVVTVIRYDNLSKLEDIKIDPPQLIKNKETTSKPQKQQIKIKEHQNQNIITKNDQVIPKKSYNQDEKQNQNIATTNNQNKTIETNEERDQNDSSTNLIQDVKYDIKNQNEFDKRQNIYSDIKSDEKSLNKNLIKSQSKQSKDLSNSSSSNSDSSSPSSYDYSSGSESRIKKSHHHHHHHSHKKHRHKKSSSHPHHHRHHHHYSTRH